MMISTDYDLVASNSFGVSAYAAHFCKVTNLSELKQALAYAKSASLPVQILGSGSNILFVNNFPGVVIQILFEGIDWLSPDGLVRVAAGENWHNFVKHCVKKDFFGVENLALIPGTAGAAPIQNIGAYGVELKDVVESVTVYDSQSDVEIEMTKNDCEFGYRDSLFKYADAKHLIVTALTLRLSKTASPIVSYGALTREFEGKNPTNSEVFDAVVRIRKSKLPDPVSLGNAGSFFKNPLVSKEKYERLKAEYPNLPGYDSDEPGLVKIPAAWLLDHEGWKGRRRGGAGVHNEHALVLVNVDYASGEEVMLLAQEMASSVLGHYGIALETEVQIL